MKTPRDILLKRHETARPQLDSIRAQIVAGLNHKATKEQSGERNFVFLFLGCLKNSWHELILPSRRVWAGLAACWVAIAIAHLVMDGRSTAPIAAATPTPEMIQAYRQQEKLLAELIGQTGPTAAEPSRKFLPQPRSGRWAEMVTV